MPTLTDTVILPACQRLDLKPFIAAERDVVLVPMPPPAPGTPALTFAFIPNDNAGDVVVEASLFAVPLARQAALSVYFTTIVSRCKGITWMIDDGVAYACAYVSLAHTGDAPAAVGAAFERLVWTLGNVYPDITRIVTGAPKRRSRAEREATRIVAPFDAVEPAPVPDALRSV